MNTVTITETKNTVSVNETTNTVTIQEGQATVVTVATEGPQGPAFADGDIGDIVISGGGTVATIDAGVINNAKVASDAAIAGSKINPTFTSNISTSGTVAANGGSIYVTGTSPAVFFTDTDNNPDYYLQDQNGTFRLVDNTNSAELFTANASTLVSKVNHDFSAGIDITGNISVSGTVDGRDVAADGTKLDTIESNATADQTASDIKTLLNSDGISNSQISGSAAIAGTKISPDFGSQNITSTGNISGGAVSGASFSGNGASITNINAANIASGQIASARVPTLNQNTTGSAATLTTARTIAGVSFDGSANIDISYASLTNKLTVGDGGLTQNNFTNTLKTKLDGVATGATNVTNTNQLTNGAGFITASDGITGNAASATVLATARTIAGASFDGSANIDISYADLTNKLSVGDGGLTQNNFTNTLKTKLDGIETGATADQTAAEILTLLSDQNIATTGTVTIGGTNPSLLFTDSDDNPDYVIRNDNGVFKVRDTTNSRSPILINTDGHIDIAGNLDCLSGVDITGDLTVSGNMTVSGTTTTIDTTTLTVEDKNIELGKVSTPTDTTADGGGITLKGATDKTFQWLDATDSWTSSEHIALGDQKKLKLGNSQDLLLHHDGSHSKLHTETGNLSLSSPNKVQLSNATGDGGSNYENMVQAIANGGVEAYYDNVKKLETTSTGVTVTGALTAGTVIGTNSVTCNNNIHLNSDSGKLSIGTGEDLQIYHSGDISRIRNTNDSGTLKIQATSNGENAINIVPNNTTELYFDGTKKLETTSTGITASGTQHLFTSGTSGNCELIIQADSDNNNENDNPKLIFRQDGSLNLSAIGHNFTGSDASGNKLFIANCVNFGGIEFYTGDTADNYTSGVKRLEITTDGNIQIPADDKKLQIGAGQDLKLYHDSSVSHSIIDNSTSYLKIRSNQFLLQNGAGDHNYIAVHNNEQGLEFFYDNSKKLETTPNGTKISGSENVENSVNALSDLSVASNYHLHLNNPANDANEAVGLCFGLSTGGDIGASIYHKRLGTNSYGDLMFATKASLGSVTERLKITSDGNLQIPDSGRLQLGASQDLELYHDGSNSYIKNTLANGDLILDSAQNFYIKHSGETQLQCVNDGAVNLYYDNSLKLATTSTGIKVTGTTTTGSVFLGDFRVKGTDDSNFVTFKPSENLVRWHDNDRVTFGGSNDLQIFHDGSYNWFWAGGGHPTIHESSGSWTVRSVANENYIIATENGAVELYYDHSKKLETASDRVNVTGHMIATGTVKGAKISVDDSSSNGVTIGSADDLQIFHDGTNSHIHDDTSATLVITNNDLRLKTSGDEMMVRCVANGSVALNYDNSAKLETTSTGVDVTGNITTSGQINISGTQPRLYLQDTNNDDDFSIYNLNGKFTIYNETDNDNALVIDSDSNVGINETSPARILHVNSGSTNEVARFESTDTEVTVEFKDTTGTASLKCRDDFRFNSSSAELARLTSTGLQITNDVTISGGQLTLGAADSASGHLNAFEVMTFNIDSDNDDTNRYFAFYKNGNSGSGTELFKILEDGNVQIANDTGKLQLGTSQDLELYHDGSNSYIDNSTGDFFIRNSSNAIKIRPKSDEESIVAHENGAVELHYDNSKKLETTASGVDVDGSVTADDIITAGALLHEGDTNTLIHFSANDTIDFKTNGSERLRVVNAGVQLFSTLYTNGRTISIGDSASATDDRITFGDSQDLQLFHDGTNGVIRTITNGGTLYLQSGSHIELSHRHSDNSEEKAIFSTINAAVDLYYDGSKKFETHASGCIFTGSLYGLDNQKIELGHSGDLKLYHDGTDSHINNYTGTFYIQAADNLVIQNTSGDKYFIGREDAAVELYYDNSKKLETTSSGVEVDGQLEIDGSVGETILKSSGAEIEFTRAASSNITCSNASGYLIINTGGSNERLRIDTSGNVLIGRTSVGSTGNGHSIRGGDSAIFSRDATGETVQVCRNDNGGDLIQFRRNSTICGEIVNTGATTVAYNTASDYRLKENEVVISDGITRLKLLKPYRFNFKSEPSKTVDGFFAHEVTPSVPEAIFGEKDDSDRMQGIDQSKLVPLLTAALQEAIAKIEVLETKVAALEAG